MKIEEIYAEVVNIILRYITPQEIFLFGSRATGSAGERSDVDIGIIANEKISASVFSDIEDETDGIRTLLKIDLVDFTSYPDGDFKTLALQKTKTLWKNDKS